MRKPATTIAVAVFSALSAMAQSPEPGRAVTGMPHHETFLHNADLSGWLLDNEGNRGRDGGGFNSLAHRLYPERGLFRSRMVGLNFEHIFNGSAAYNDIAMFTPRREPNYLLKQGPQQATLRWPADMSAWGVACSMTYTFSESDAIDMRFTAVPLEEKWPHGYLAFMWASYMQRAVDRPIHFWGVEDGGEARWIRFGAAADNVQGFETGTVAFAGEEPLPFDPDAQALNIVEHPAKRFVYPFYYGLLDGDQDLTTDGDALAYIVMFDQTAPIRFALWNFIKDDAGNPDPHSPAWDWQYVIRDPKVGERYGYKMRVVVTPFTTRADILARYRDWAGE
ncbi:MAG: hypothetical protein KF886_26055 [Candidatus Hydrogenedentes bacterium]|nr:hypothetical protein [Candidatus Hydrogenedentota bacterium]